MLVKLWEGKWQFPQLVCHSLTRKIIWRAIAISTMAFTLLDIFYFYLLFYNFEKLVSNYSTGKFNIQSKYLAVRNGDSIKEAAATCFEFNAGLQWWVLLKRCGGKP